MNVWCVCVFLFSDSWTGNPSLGLPTVRGGDAGAAVSGEDASASVSAASGFSFNFEVYNNLESII